MLKSTPIVVLDDDVEEHVMIQQIFESLQVKSDIRYFTNAEEALEYLRSTTDSPFIIFCDVNLPKTDGLEFKRQIDNDEQLRKKSIPFVFYTTSAKQKEVNIAYQSLILQGYFEKPNDPVQAKNLIKLILEYWYHCKHPNSFLQQTTLR